MKGVTRLRCAKQLVLACIITPLGENFWGTNWCEHPQKKCPRGSMPSGQGYDLCRDICGQRTHAEIDALQQAGDEAQGGMMLVFGHTYCCDSCVKAMKAAGLIGWYAVPRSVVDFVALHTR